MAQMCESGELELPLPVHGRTVARWSVLGSWGRLDLPVARRAEGHSDAVAILAEAGRQPIAGAAATRHDGFLTSTFTGL